MSTMQLRSNAHAVRAEATQWAKALMLALLVGAVLFALSNVVHATTTDEFSAVTTKFENWVTGNLGKLAAFIALGVGAIVAAVKKDWSWFFGAVVISVGVGILVTIVNASFTAVI